MITGNASGVISFRDGDGIAVYIESGSAGVSVLASDTSVHSGSEAVQIGPLLESPPKDVAAIVSVLRFDDASVPGEVPSQELWIARWSGWTFQDDHVLLDISVGVQGRGAQVVAIGYYVSMHGHVERGPLLQPAPLRPRFGPVIKLNQ